MWSQWGEALWVFVWALAGGLLAWYYYRQYYLILVFLITLPIICFVFCFVLFVWGWWVCVVPSALALVVAGGTVFAYRLYYYSQSRILHSQSSNLEENRIPTRQPIAQKLQNLISKLFNRQSRK